MAGGRRRRTGLEAEERALWARVIEDVTPLRRWRRGALLATDADLDAATQAVPATPEPTASPAPLASRATSAAPATKPAQPAPLPLAPIERRLVTRLVRGVVPVDGRLDLHGLTQHVAERRLVAFLTEAQSRGARLVLVITGKGRSGPHDVHTPEERGVLRRVVPGWLARPDLRPIVLGFEEAHVAHGGEGALYVRLRRSRRHP